MEFVDLVDDYFPKMEDVELHMVDDANKYNEQFVYGNPSVNKGIAIVSASHESNLQPSSNSVLASLQVQVALISQYFLLLDVNGILLATHYGQIGKERVKLYHIGLGMD
jgi:hypothetical protein